MTLMPLAKGSATQNCMLLASTEVVVVIVIIIILREGGRARAGRGPGGLSKLQGELGISEQLQLLGVIS